MDTSFRTLRQKALHEMKSFFIIAAYLWVIFALMIEYKSVVLAAQHTRFVAHGLALINALALAKVIVIAKMFRLGEVAGDVPLIYPTLLKSALFSVLLACFKILEEYVIGRFRGESFRESITSIGGGTLEGILCLTTIMFVVLIPFFGYLELERVLGEGKLEQLFLGRRRVESQPAPGV